MASSPSNQSLQTELLSVGVNDAAGQDFLRGVLAGCADCIKILDLEGRLQFMSEGGKRVMEVEDFELLKGCPWPDFWAGEGNSKARQAVEAAKAGGTFRFQDAANTARGTPRYWDVQLSPIFGADRKPTHLLSISRDITEEWRAAQEQQAALERQTFLTAELTHRVKNTLATVLAIANQSFRGDIHKEPRDAFLGRIKTMGEAYNVLTEASWTCTSIKLVVEGALAPYRNGTGRFTISRLELNIKPAQALILALAINELATNAMKYGALSVPSGSVAIDWVIVAGEKLRFEWRETGGPEVTSPSRSGFGSRLIKTLLAGDFGGTVDLSYNATGVTCVLEAPVSNLA